MVVLLALVAEQYSQLWTFLIPGYSAIREAHPYYFALTYFSLVEIVLVGLVAIIVLHGSGKTILDALGVRTPRGRAVLVLLLMVLPEYLVFGYRFDVADMVFFEVLFLAVISPLAEELLFRGLAFGFLRKFAGWRFWPAAILPAIFFAADHYDANGNFTDNAMTMLITSVGALLFTWLFERWNSLWVPIGLHISMNFAWNLFNVGDRAYAGSLPTVMLVTTALLAIVLTRYYTEPMAPRD